jgi:hypothetical protein
MFQVKKLQFEFASLDHGIPYSTSLTCPIPYNTPIHHEWFTLTIKPNEQYFHLQEENIDCGHNKMNNTFIDEGFETMLTWCMAWFEYVSIAKTFSSIT